MRRSPIHSRAKPGLAALPQPIIALEKRIAFDGAAAATVAKTVRHALTDSRGDDNNEGAARSTSATRDQAGAADRNAMTDGTARSGSILSGIASSGILRDGGNVRTATQPTSVVFIESDVPDIGTMIKDIDHSAQIVILDSNKDGVDAIASYLAAHKGVQDVYIFSHGSDATLSLGTATLDSASMQGRYAADLATIKGSLGADANILVYGCDFAQGASGDAAARLLSQLTGADVAASTNLTGGTAEGGDFVLEDQIGTITAPDVLRSTIASDYDGLLASPTTIFANTGTGAYKGNLEFLTFANTSIATGGITNGATATYKTAEGGTVTVTFSNVSNATDAATFKPAALTAYSPSKLSGGYNNAASSSIMLYGGYSGTASFTVTISAKDANGNSYTPNVAFADGEVTDASGESYTVTTNGGNFQNVETIGTNSYALTGTGTQSITLSNTVNGVPVLVTDNATSLNVTVQINGGKEGFVLALVDPTLSLDSNGSSGAPATDYQTTFTEKGAAVAIAGTDTSAVEPGGSAASAKIVLTNAQVGDVLGVAGALPTGITSTIDTSIPGQITVNLSGNASLASYQTAIEDVTFANTSSDPSTVDRTIDVTYNDGGQNSNTTVSTVHVTAVNDAPVETGPATQTTNKDTTLTISGLSVSDVDANGGNETVTLSVSDGTISLASTNGLSFSTGTGTKDTSETFTGTLSAIDAAISTVKYQPTTGYIGSDTLLFSTDDNGNTGTGGAMTASKSVGITVKNVNPTAVGTIANQRYSDGQANVSLATSQAFSDSLGLALTYGATGLPKGLTIDASTGRISGTVDHDASTNAPTKTGSGATLDGTYTVIETASDGQGGSTTQTFKIDSTNQAPVVGTKTANQSNKDGDAIAALNAASAFSDPNGDPLTYAATGLPAGLSISSAGMITGTVAKNAAPGTYAVAVTATDDKGATATEGFSWLISDVPPAANGTLANQVVNDGQSGIAIATAKAFVDANGNALSYSASGLPAGLTINAATGVITGTINHDASKNAPATTGSGATLVGTYSAIVTASDGLGGTATQSFTINSSNSAPLVGTNTANQTNNDGATVTAVDTSKAFSDPNGDPLTYTASNLPKGLVINASTGVISGTVAANATPGTTTVRVVATDDKGAATREVFTWTINDVPPTANGTLPNKTYADATSSINITTASGFSNPNGLALTYSTAGLPKGLSIDPATGIITGQLDHDASANAPVTSGAGATLDGTYTVTITASDGQGGTATQTFKIDATNQAPKLVAQTPDQQGADGQKVSLDGAKPFNDPNVGDVITYTATGLPAGLTINASTGLISGTIDPHASTQGPFTVSVTATDDKGATTSETFKWTVADVPPVATPALPAQSAYDGTNVSYATASGFTNPNNIAYTYTATGLPQGLTIDPHSGVISGTLNHDASTGGSGGGYTIAVTANDGQGGTATNSFTLTASNQAPVVGTKTANQTNSDGDAVSGVDASKAFSDPNGDPLTYRASNLPSGLTINASTGLITGTVAANASAGTYSVAVTATDDKGAATVETFNWTIDAAPPQVAAALPAQNSNDGTAINPIATASGFSDKNNNTLTYSASGLPAGLSIDPVTGIISGTLDHDASKNAPTTTGAGATLDGTYMITVTASDKFGGAASQSFTFDATNGAPTVATQTAGQTNAEGDVISVNVGKAFADSNTGDILTYAASGLPAGLTINASTGLVTGTVQSGDMSATPYQITVTATDDKGAATSETFNWTILAAPTSTSTIPNVASFDGNAVSIDTGSHFSGALTYASSALPTGLSINPLTGAITGTLSSDASLHGSNPTGSGATLDSTYTIVVTATNAGGSTQQSFVLDVENQAPVIVAGSATANQSNKDGETIAGIDASTAFSDPNGDALTYSAANLPSGLTIASNGKISGTIAGNAAPGAYTVSVTATDDKGAARTETFVWTVADVPPTPTGTIATQTVADGQNGVSIATATAFTGTNGNALVFSAAGLPAGLSIDAATGLISGSIDHDASANGLTTSGSGATLVGSYAVTVSVSDNLGGTATQTFTINSSNGAPTVGTNTVDQHGQDGQTVSINAAPAFTDPNGDPLIFSATNLPTGLTIDPTTGLITGAIDKSASAHGAYAVSVTATDDKGAATTETFNYVVDDLAPQATPPLPARSVNDGTAVSYATAGGFTNPNNVALTFSATGLPQGLTIDPTTGLISGTLDHEASAAVSGGLYTVAVTVSDGQGGAATNTFLMTASNQAPLVGTPTLDRANTDGQTITPIDASKVFSDPNPGDTLTYSASNLPKGLSIDPTTGIISGTVSGTAAPGAYLVTVTATDDKGAATPETFTWTVGDNPPVTTGTIANATFADGQGGISITAGSVFSSPDGAPLTFTATGLPHGLTIDPASGLISGYIGHDSSLNAPVKTGSGATLDGTYTVTVTASDGQGGLVQQSFTIDATNQAPNIGMPTAAQQGADGQQVSLNVAQPFADPNTGDVLTYTANGLPAGLAINAATGLITGTIDPHASASGPYAVTVTATDDKGAATSETFTWAVSEVPPVAGTPFPTTTVPDGTATQLDTASHFSSLNGLPLTFSASGLPKGLSIDAATGLISGTLDHDASAAAAGGAYTITITASDGQGGTAVQSLTIDATNQAPVVGTPTAAQSNSDGATIAPVDASKAFTDPNAGDVLTYTAANLPKGLAIDPATGLITGTIDGAAAPGNYAVTVTATDDKGAATSETFAWTVSDVPPVAGAPLSTASIPDGTATQIDTASHFSSPDGLPLTYTASGLPKGLSIDAATGLISGTLDHDASAAVAGGAYAITITASDGQGGTAQQTFTIDAINQAPVVGAPTPDQSNLDGQTIAPVDASKAFSDPNTGDTLTYSASNLPKGLAIDPLTGAIFGTVDGGALPGKYLVTVTATDDKGAATSETLTWTIGDAAPLAGGPLPNQTFNDGQAGIAIDTGGAFTSPTGRTLTYSATGLPHGLSIDPATGRITGTLDADAAAAAPFHTSMLEGVYAVTVTATDDFGGTASQTFAIDVDHRPPTIAAPTPDQRGTPGASTTPLDVSSAFADTAGEKLTYAVNGLPPGLSLDPATGQITGTLAASIPPGSVFKVTVTATDPEGASVTEAFAYTVGTVPPSIVPPAPALAQPSFLEPVAALPPLRPPPAVLAAPTSNRSIETATPVLDAVDAVAGAEERSQVISATGIVVSTVNGVAPLDGQQDLQRPGAGIVRSGAATNEEGDLYQRTEAGLGRGIEALATPLNFLGASSIDLSGGDPRDGTAINIETIVRDRVLAVGIDNGTPGLGSEPLAAIYVTLLDGRPLPPWLRMEGKGYLVGKVPAGVETLDLRITTTLRSGMTSQRTVRIRTDRGTITPHDGR